MHALTLLVAYLLGVIAVARATRLVTHDPYPPIQAARLWWVSYQSNRDWDPDARRERTGPAHGWGSLVTCPFCAAPYIAAAALAVAIWAGVWSPGWSWASAWMVAAVWASGSYLASMVVLRDEPADE